METVFAYTTVVPLIQELNSFAIRVDVKNEFEEKMN